MANKNFLRLTTYAAVFGLIGGMSFEGVSYLSNKVIGDTVVESVKEDAETSTVDKIDTTSIVNSSYSSDDSSNGVSDIAENVLPSIVAIDVTATETATDIFGRTYSQDATGSGSGIIVGQDEEYLYIATNNHVVDGATSVSVKFNDDSVYSAKVKGTDSSADIAVIEVALSDISSETMGNIKIAVLGDSDEVKIGEQAIAIGNALGYGTSVTVGYISAKDREVSVEDLNMKLLQTDAAINPGNSGGALVNINGEIIGINSSKYAETSVEGMGFAIPINTAAPIIDSIVKAEVVSEEDAAYLGIKGKDVETEYAQYYNIPEGIYIGEVTSGAPAAESGIKVGDIIVKFNGMDVTEMQGLQEKLALCKAGDEVEIVVKRADDGEWKEKTFTVTLGRKADAVDASSNEGQEGYLGQDKNNGSYGSGQDDNSGSYGNDSSEGRSYGRRSMY